jgi:predicted ATPase/tetratricopeptide (TPR) repeat protein
VTTGPWERIQELFERALDLAPDARPAFLHDACAGDSNLMREVAALLEAHDRSDDLPSLPTAWLGTLEGPEADRFTPGEQVADRYEIRGLLGRGGMGEVYEAWDRDLGIEVALKTLRIDTQTDESYRRLKMEGLLARSVWHPNVCRLYDLGRHDGERGPTWFLTMERLHGDTLSSRLSGGRRLSQGHARQLAEQMAAALGAAHAAGVVHRDFKPGNVILVGSDGDERAVVTDFGIARSVTGAELDDREGSVFAAGTPVYMAPEQVRGEPGGPGADIYALGIVLYEMVTGRPPFRDGSSLETARRRLTEPPPSPRGIVPDLDEHWETTILRCLELDPERRFRRAEDVAAALSGRAAGLESNVAITTSGMRSSLPPELDDFVGRETEIEALDRLYADDARVVTLSGAAGMGKTRLALRFGWRRLDGWPGGVWFCDLKDARDVHSIASAVARAFGLPLGRQDPVEQLAQVISVRGRCLLILDNFEQVVELAPASVGAWLEKTSEARFLVTSRERLRLGAAERVHSVEPLGAEAALELFTTRARRLQPGIDLQGPDAEAAREIVRLIDGMPLAIELAAARVRVMPISQIAAQLRDRFRLLTGGRTTRHETLAIAIDGSWDLLRPWEQTAWVQCSVFEDGFTLEAAEHVLDRTGWPERPAVVDVLQSLVERNLLRTMATAPSGSIEVRFGMYVSLHDYARHKLRESQSGVPGIEAPLPGAERRHGAWYSRYGTDTALESLDEKGGAERRQHLDRELANLVAAARRASSRGDGGPATWAYRAAVEVLALRGPFATAIEIGLQILRLDLSVPERVRVLFALARMERLSGMKEVTRAHSEEALALARGTSDRRLTAILVGWRGNLEYDEGATESARVHYEEALSQLRDLGDDRHAGLMLSNLGVAEAALGRYEDAAMHYESALELLKRAGDLRREGYVHSYLGSLHRGRGRFAEALSELTLSLAINREMGDRMYESQTIGNLGNLHVEMGSLEEARACYESAVAMNRETGDRRNEGLFLSNLANLHLRQNRLEEARVCLETALSHHRVVGTRTMEGYALGLLGRVSHREGRLEEARLELTEAEAIMREVRHPVELGRFLCFRGELELDCSNVPSAKAALEEVESMAAAHGWGPQSEIGDLIAKLRDAVSRDRA